MRSLVLPQDSAGFVRRECPYCRRQFKTRPFPSDGLAVQRYLGKVMPHENVHEADCAPGRRACLYCGKTAAPEAWLTLEQCEHLNRVGQAFADELRYEQLLYVGRTLSSNPRPTFIPVPPGEPRTAMAPEPDDLELVPLLCCGEDAKGLSGWAHSLFCPRCGARQQSTRIQPSSLDEISE